MKINIFILAIIIIFSFYFSCSQPKISGLTGLQNPETTVSTLINNDTSTDTTGLVGLEIIGTNISSIFKSDITEYNLFVDYNVEGIAVFALKDSNARKIILNAKFDGANDSSSDLESGKYSKNIKLNYGENNITLTVIINKGVDEKAFKYYKIKIFRNDNNNTLASLLLSNGILSLKNGAYESTVSNAANKINIKAKPRESNAKMIIIAKFDGINDKEETLSEDTFSNEINLNVGENNIKIKVTAPDGKNEGSYIVKITRKDKTKNPIITPEYVKFSGSVKVKLLCETEGAKIFYVFDKNATPANKVGFEAVNNTEITLTETRTIKAIAVIEGKDDSDIITKTYIKMSSNNDLSDIIPSIGRFTSIFDKNITNYTLIVSNSVNEITLKAVKEDNSSDMKLVAKYDGINEETKDLQSNVNSQIIKLQDSSSTIKIEVTAEDGAKKEYIVNIEKRNISSEVTFAPMSQDFSGSVEVKLSSLTSGANIVYTTDGSIPSRSNGTQSANNTTIMIDKTTNLKAFCYINGMDDSYVTSKTYTRLSDNPNIESIYISNGGLRPAFSPDITEYELDLSVSVSKIKVAVKSEENNASMKVTAKYDGTNEITKDLAYNTPTEDITILKDNDRLSIKVTSPSGLSEKTYTFNIKKKNVTSNPLLLLSSEYDLSNDSMILFIGSVTDGAKIRVTYDGSTPNRTNGSDFPNGGYLILHNSYTIKAFAYVDGMEDSPISELNFDITKYKPYIIDVMVNNESIPFNFNKKAEGYFWEVNSSLENCVIKAICENPKATMSIKTKFNGTDEVIQSLSHYTNSNLITLNPEQNWIEITVTSENKEVTKTYYFVMRKNINSVANPIINPKNSSFAGNIGVMLESHTPDSTIIYTLDGRIPDKYNGLPVPNGTIIYIEHSCVLKAIAIKDGFTNSDVVTSTYTKLSNNTNLSSVTFSRNCNWKTGNFRKSVSGYILEVSSDVETISIKPFLEDNSSKMTVNGVLCLSGNFSQNINLPINNTTLITVRVISEYGTTRDYEFFIYRPNYSVGSTTTTTTIAVTTTSSSSTATTTTTTTTIPNGNLKINISFSSPDIKSIIFNPQTNISVKKGDMLIIDGVFTGGTNWKWYVDNVLVDNDALLNLNTSAYNTGKHYISVTTEKSGIGYSGFISFSIND